ncbi:MAG: DUF5694 domain-containing protein [Fimbriimonadaceae bacterium]
MKPTIMILGTYHMTNPGVDAVKVAQRDTLGPARQVEIVELVKRLSEFQPSKICVEYERCQQNSLDNDFLEFLDGKAPLNSNEIQQIGFRLAQVGGLRRLYASDYRAPMDFASVMEHAESTGKSAFVAGIQQLLAELGKTMSDWDQQFSVGELLAIQNCPRYLVESQAFYTAFLGVDGEHLHPAADMLSKWYRRNLIIYENIRRVAQPGDRVLVIYGSGHGYYLNQLAKDDPEVALIEASTFLPEPPDWDLPKLA